ncbi:bifunctional DNA primase/polymerase [Methylococcus sp. ANG]|uniref:bifunctional DNA primase/polymerase n=1 Tax=Methylococcus sp. ANG TaxID=3231903 RepID=UPI00345B1E28
MSECSAARQWQKPRWRHRRYRGFEGYVRYGGWKLCAIRAGTKAPTGGGWNRRENAIADPNQAAKLEAAGLLHAWSGTAALDIDDFPAALEWLEARGINLMALLGAPDAVQINSGKPNKGKLLYRLAAPRPSVKVVGNDGQVIFELRSGSAAGLTVQDTLPPSQYLARIFQESGRISLNQLI